ncbi:hypothetical protein J6590_004395 [Homalodisca vitripennis]|nr:hypothetical protein J6590_004395 [Homalodisca vitripennis]
MKLKGLVSNDAKTSGIFPRTFQLEMVMVVFSEGAAGRGGGEMKTEKELRLVRPLTKSGSACYMLYKRANSVTMCKFATLLLSVLVSCSQSRVGYLSDKCLSVRLSICLDPPIDHTPFLPIKNRSLPYLPRCQEHVFGYRSLICSIISDKEAF